MTPDALLIGLMAAPVLLLMLLRVNASLVFLSTCLGIVLLKYVGEEAGIFAKFFAPALGGNNLDLALLLLPVVLTTVFMIRTVQGFRLAFNVLPAAGTSCLLALLIVPLLPFSLYAQIKLSATWHQLENLQAMVVGLSALVCLFFLWTQRRKPVDKHGKHHK